MREEIIGNCRLILGDCRDFLPSLDGVDSILMDSPYGDDYQSGYATDDLWIDGRRIIGDKNTEARDFVVGWSKGRPTLAFGKWSIERPKGTKMVLIWDKGGALGMGDLSIPWKPDHEEIYVLGAGFIGRRDSGSVIRVPPVQSMAKNGRLHPNQKPVELLTTLIRKLPGTICDPFMGSGSTGVACVKMDRKFIGIELSEKFFDISCRRIEAAVRELEIHGRTPDIFTGEVIPS